MNEREAMKITINFLFSQLIEERNLEYDPDEIKLAVQGMHDDDTFLTSLLDFFEDHLEIFGENYGLEY